MASEDEAVSKLKEWRTAAHQRGTDTELLSIKSNSAMSAKLYVLCGDHFNASKAFRAGDFSVRVIRLSGNSVSMVTCMVGDHQWVLAKDSMAIRVGPWEFVFALPGLLYGLALPGGWGVDDQQYCKVLEEILASFSAYQDLMGIDGSTPKPESGNYWANAYSKILTLATKSSTKITTTTTTSSSTIIPKSSSDATSSRKIHRAVRMSAALKLLSRALLSGALVPKDHLHISTALGASHAYPTMWAVAEILDAIEIGKSSTRARRASPAKGLWGLKEEGVGKLMDIVKAYSSSATSEGVGMKKKRVRRDGEERSVEDEGKRRGIGGSLVKDEKREESSLN